MLTQRLTAAALAAIFAACTVQPSDARPQIKDGVSFELSAKRKHVRRKSTPSAFLMAQDESCGPVGCAGPISTPKRARSHSKDVEASSASFSFGGLADRARAYMGTNPTGRSRLWCGDFMAMIAPNAASQIRNPRMARDWAQLPHVGPQVGAIAVLSRGRRGGHVGIVTGFDANGNPIILSGNHNRVVGEGVYSSSRVIAYVAGS